MHYVCAATISLFKLLTIYTYLLCLGDICTDNIPNVTHNAINQKQ